MGFDWHEIDANSQKFDTVSYETDSNWLLNAFEAKLSTGLSIH